MKNFYNKTKFVRIAILIFSIFFLSLKFSYADNNRKAKIKIDNLMTDLIIYVKNKENKNDVIANKDKLLTYLNLDFMARATSGRYWKKASKKEQLNYKKLLFSKILHSINLHTNKLKTMNFIHKKIEKRGEKLIYVKGLLKNEDKQEVNVIWKMYSKDLTILDLQIEKISLIKTQKSETINLLRKYKGNFKKFLDNFQMKDKDA